MDLFKKYFATISNFIITCILCIFNTLIVVAVDGTLQRTFDRDTYYTDWKVLIIILLCVILFMAVMSFLFNLPQTANSNKTAQTILLVINIVITIACILFWVIIQYKIYNYSYLLAIEEEELSEIEMSNFIVNGSYQESFLLLVFSSLSNLIAPICSLAFIKGEKKEEDKNEEESEDDDAKDIRTEINKLKKQLELEDLKKEYASLYKKLQNNKEEKKSDGVIKK